MFGHPKTQPRGNPGPPTNALILARETSMQQYDVVGAHHKNTDTPMILATTKNKFNANKRAETMPFGVADGPGNPYPDRNFNMLAVTTHGPSTLLVKSIGRAEGETLATGMCVYPCPFGDDIHVGTLKYLISKAKGDPFFDGEFKKLKENMQGVNSSSVIIDLYMRYTRPFAMIVNYQSGSEYAQVMINPQIAYTD